MKTSKNYLLIHCLMCLSYSTMFAQFENYLWLFGENNAGIAFDLNTRQANTYNMHQALQFEASSVVTNPQTGALVFYTDGTTAYNSQHNVIENGDGLLGCFNTVQTIVVPIPGKANQYYLFANSTSIHALCPNSNLSVSIVDMNANDGLGKLPLASKNIIIRESILEGMVIVEKPGGGAWLIGVDLNTGSNHYVFSISRSGIELAGTYDLGLNLKSFNLTYSDVKRKVAVCSQFPQRVYTLDFDPFTGVLNNYQVIDGTMNKSPYDVEWSPDGSKLYYSSAKQVELRQYDFNNQSITTLYSAAVRGGGLKLGPDGMIYYIHYRGGTTLSRIKNPNASGEACNFSFQNFDLGTTLDAVNFPEHIHRYLADSWANDPISGTINDYVEVLDYCGNVFNLADSTLLQAEDRVLLIQMKGATVDKSNSSQFGRVTDYGQTGKYEFNDILSVEGSTVTLKKEILQDYQIEGRLQMIRVPNLGNATVSQLTCLPWNGKTGGVLVFEGGIIEQRGDIDVCGFGFRAPNYDNVLNTNCDHASAYVFPATRADSAGLKGEGLVDLPAHLSRGKGFVSIGGGGGNNHNNGGGGGASCGNGGHGGYWTGCGIFNEPLGRGLGGVGFSDFALEGRLIMGGAGGAGHSNNNWGVGGGNGGGIVIAVIEQWKTNGFSIKANGAGAMAYSTFTVASDGGGGGGGGGTILLSIAQHNGSKINIETKGGDGASMKFDHGHGGGGAGGVLIANGFSVNELNLERNGGRSGMGENGARNWAQDGEAGWLYFELPIQENDIDYKPFHFTGLEVDTDCDGNTSLQVLNAGGHLAYSYRLDHMNWTNNSRFENLEEGWFTLQAKDACQTLDTQINIVLLENFKIDDYFEQAKQCESLGSVELDVTGGQAPYRYQLMGEDWQIVPYFKDLEARTYTFIAADTRNCMDTLNLPIEDLTQNLIIDLPSDTFLHKGSEILLRPQLENNLSSTYAYHWSPAEGLSCTDCAKPIARPEETTTYTLMLTDQFGCTGSASVHVNVLPNGLYIPNAFSPNRDGINDKLLVYAEPGKVERIVHFSIYDRGGTKVFEANQFLPNDNQYGWDGRMRGQWLNPQMFVYRVEAIFYDGNYLEEYGMINLLR